MAGPVVSLLLRQAEPFLEWLLPFLYRPKIETSAWEVGFAVDDVPRDIDLDVMTPDEIADLIVRKGLSGQFSYSFEADLYSYTGTGLRSPVVVFISEGGQEDVHTPIERNPKRPLRVLNLPSRQWVHQEIRGSFPIHGAAAQRLAVCKRAKFRAYLPSRRPFETTIVEEPLKSTIP